MPLLLDEPSIAPVWFPDSNPYWYATASDGEVAFVFAGGSLVRVDRDGNLLDVPARKLPGFQPQAADYGDGVVVVAETEYSQNMVSAFSREGQRLWTIPAREDDSFYDKSLVFNGHHFVLAWRNISGLHIRAITPAGQIVRSLDLGESRSGEVYGRSAPVLARTATGTLLAWIEYRRAPKDGAQYWLVAMKLDAAGPVHPPRHLVPVRLLGGTSIAAASDGVDALLLYPGDPSLQSTPLRGLRIGDDAQILESRELVRAGYYEGLRALWDGSQYRVTWSEGHTVHAIDVDRSLAVPRAPKALGSGEDARLVRAGDRLVLTTLAPPYLRVKTSDAAMPVGNLAGETAKHALLERADEVNPTAIWTGDRYLVVWGRQAEAWELRARTFDITGRPLSPPVTVASGLSEQPQELSLATNGRVVLALWLGWYGHLLFRIAPDGQPLDHPLPYTSRFDAHSIGLASNGEEFLMAWSSWRSLRVRTLNADGEGLEREATTIYDGPIHDYGRNHLVFDGKDYLFSYEACSYFCSVSPVEWPYVARLDRQTGALLATTKLSESEYATSSVTLTTNGRELLATHESSKGQYYTLLRDLSPTQQYFENDDPLRVKDELQRMVWTGRSWFGITAGLQTVELDSRLTRRTLGRLDTSSSTTEIALVSDGTGGVFAAWTKPVDDAKRGYGMLLQRSGKQRAVAHGD